METLLSSSAYLYTSARTPFGKYGGALSPVRPDDLAAAAIHGILKRSPALDPARVDEVTFGNANGAGEENRNVGRMALLLAGMPVTVPGQTINRLCGSSLDAAMAGSRLIETGDAGMVIAGGVESMSRAPWVIQKPSQVFPAQDIVAESTTLGWRLVNERMPAGWTMSLGSCNEILVDKYKISRERQDHFAVRSHRLAAQAWDEGFYDELVDPFEDIGLKRDEGIRTDADVERLSRLKAVFKPGGAITAGNASPLNDGASAVLLANETAASEIGLQPIARVAGRGASAIEPPLFGIAPVQAAQRALRRAGIDWSQVGAVELNEAFAVQAIACIDQWGIDPDIVNTRGGAIALGHPLGASGTRLLATLAHRMKRDHQRWGVAAICIGVGQALAVVLENTR